MNSVVPISNPAIDPRQRSYQELKAKIHNDLLNRLNLERLTQMGQKEAEPEIRRMILEIIERSNETTPLNLTERETLVVDVLNELFGLGPLEALLARPEHLGHPRQPLRPGLRRARWPARTDRHPLPRRPPPDADHRAHRQHRRPPHRRVEPDGRRRLRDGSRVNAIIPPLAIDGPVALDSAFPHRPGRRRRHGRAAKR